MRILLELCFNGLKFLTEKFTCLLHHCPYICKGKNSVKVLSETDAESRMRHAVSLWKTLRIRAASDLPEHTHLLKGEEATRIILP